MAGLSIMPTKMQREKVEYMVVTYISVIFCCIFPYIHGRNKRRILDFILGFILIYLANGKWTFVLIVMSMVGYIYAHLPIPSIQLKKKGKTIDIRTISAIAISMIYTTFIHHLFMSTKDRPEGPVVGEFYFNTCMIVVMKIGYLSRMKPEKKVSVIDWLCYCFTVNGSLSGMAVKYEHWEEWLEEKYLETKIFMRKKSLLKAIQQTIIGSIWSLGFLVLFDPAMEQVNTMDLIKYNKFASEHGITNRVAITLLNLLFLGIASFAHRCMYYVIWLCFWAAICGSQFSLKEIKHREPEQRNVDVKQIIAMKDNKQIKKIARRGRREKKKQFAININDCFSSPETPRADTDTYNEMSFQNYYNNQQEKQQKKLEKKEIKQRRKHEKKMKKIGGKDGKQTLKDEGKKGSTVKNVIAPVTKSLVPLDFTRDKNIDPVRIELSTTMTELVYYWNALAAKYWRNSVFRPLLGLGFPAHISMIITNTVSALWHGSTFGFLVFFWLATLAMLGARPGWKLVRPGIVIPAEEAKKNLEEGKGNKIINYIIIGIKNVYNFSCHIITKVILEANEIPFVELTYDKVSDFLRRIYYYNVWVPLVLYVLNTLAWAISPHLRKYKKIEDARKEKRRKSKKE